MYKIAHKKQKIFRRPIDEQVKDFFKKILKRAGHDLP